MSRFFSWNKDSGQTPAGAPLQDQYGNDWHWARHPGGRLSLRGQDGQVDGDYDTGMTVRDPSIVHYPNTQGLPDYFIAKTLVVDEETGRVISGSWLGGI